MAGDSGSTSPDRDAVYEVAGVAVPDSLDQLHDLMTQVGDEHPAVAELDLSMLETAVIEIAGNLVEHGRPAGAVSYHLRLEVLPDRLEGLLADSGEALPEGCRPGGVPENLVAAAGPEEPPAGPMPDGRLLADSPRGQFPSDVLEELADDDMPDLLDEDGRGILIARAVLDELSYCRRDDANTWRMVRLRRPAGAAST